MIGKRERLLMITYSTIIKTERLKPLIMHWLHAASVTPMLTYGSLIWWTKTTQYLVENYKTRKSAEVNLPVYYWWRKSTPTAATETMLNLRSLDIYIRRQKRLGAH